jgi:hypothetical protein
MGSSQSSTSTEHGGGGAIPGRSWFDAYSLRAQWAPVLTAILPVVFAACASVPELASFKGATGGGLLVAGLPPILAQFSRNRGKALEPKLWAEWGGKPTTRLLRHRDKSIAEPTKARYFETLRAAGIVRPTPEQEAADPAAADAQYESAGDWLRRHTRHPKPGDLVSAKNASYGFARNALGLRWIGLTLAIATMAAVGTYAVHLHLSATEVSPMVVVAFLVNVGAAALWIFAVSPAWVRSEADAYAVALLECSEKDASARPSPKSPPNKEKDGAKPTSPFKPTGKKPAARTKSATNPTSPTQTSPGE